jgi:hypothetical protein
MWPNRGHFGSQVLASNLLLEIAYLGSVGRKLESLLAFNESLPGTTGSVLSRAPHP